MSALNYVSGTDEVGRGCIAGPIVSASFCINITDLYFLQNSLTDIEKSEFKSLHKKRLQRVIKLIEHDLSFFDPPMYIGASDINSKLESNDIQSLQFVFDSKQVSQKNRELLVNILQNMASVGVGEISSKQIDKIGLQQANIKSIKLSFDYASNQITKTTKNQKFKITHLSDFVKTKERDCKSGDSQMGVSRNIVKGDTKSFVIGAASIIAKVYRDNLMQKFHKQYPNYGFDKHVGYGTKQHLQAIKKYGPCQIHRISYNLFN